jgi:iron-sulfur cluster assembly protein
MLTVTGPAVQAIDHLLSAQGIHRDEGGLRLTLNPLSRRETTLSVEVVAHAPAGDDLIDAAGTQVFLDRETRMSLADKVLDVTKNAAGHLAFVVVPSAEPARRRLRQRRKATSG